MDLTILENIVYRLKNIVPNEDLERSEEYLDHNEWGLAYEYICVMLYEYEISITRKEYEAIEKFGKKIETSESYWLRLQELIKE